MSWTEETKRLHDDLVREVRRRLEALPKFRDSGAADYDRSDARRRITGYLMVQELHSAIRTASRKGMSRLELSRVLQDVENEIDKRIRTTPPSSEWTLAPLEPVRRESKLNEHLLMPYTGD